MMKFYSKPEIEALALDVVDVIETSTATADATAELNKVADAAGANITAEVKVVNEQIAEMTTDWQW